MKYESKRKKILKEGPKPWKTKKGKAFHHKTYRQSFLDYCRRKKKLSPCEMYRGLGWTAEHYYNHVTKGCRFPPEQYGTLCKVLAVPFEKLLKWIEEWHRPVVPKKETILLPKLS